MDNLLVAQILFITCMSYHQAIFLDNTRNQDGCKAPSTQSQSHLRSSPDDPWFPVGRVVKYYCDDSYQLVGNQKTICIKSNVWNGQKPTCHLEGCEHPGRFENGYYLDSKWNMYNSGTKPINDFILAYCNRTETPIPVYRTCQSDGVWSGVDPYCPVATCDAPRPPLNGYYIFINGSNYQSGEVSIGTKISLKCIDTFISIGTNDSVCQTNGTWSNFDHTCVRVTCSGPSHVTNGGYYTGNSTRYTGWTVNLNTEIYGFCDIGYFSPHNGLRKCSANGRWSGVAPDCSQITCSTPTGFDNGKYFLSFGNVSENSIFQLNDSILVKCYDGFTLTTVRQRQCIRNGNFGKWDGEDPVCSPVTQMSQNTGQDKISAAVSGTIGVLLLAAGIGIFFFFRKRLHLPRQKQPRRNHERLAGTAADRPGGTNYYNENQEIQFDSGYEVLEGSVQLEEEQVSYRTHNNTYINTTLATPNVEATPDQAYYDFRKPMNMPSTAIKVENLLDLVSSNNAKERFEKEFKSLPQGMIETYTDAMKSQNKKKNRYTNLYAYNDTRVVLDLDEESGCDSDYINACYINGFKQVRTYIASQGPTKDTLLDFWRMVWQVESCKIVMLTNVVEEGKSKCKQYWPEHGSEMFGNVEVVLKNIEKCSQFTVRTFTIKKRR